MHSLSEPQQPTAKIALGNTLASSLNLEKSPKDGSQGDLEADFDGSLIRCAHDDKTAGGLFGAKHIREVSGTSDVYQYGAKHAVGEAGTADVHQGGAASDKLNAANEETKGVDNKVLDPKVADQKQTIIIETSTSTGKVVVEQNSSTNKVVTSDLKSMTETIRSEVSSFQANDIASGSITIKIKPSNLGEIVIIMEKDAIPAGSKVFDKATGAPIDIRLVATNPEVRNYLSLIKREIGGAANVRSINISNQVTSVRSSEKSSFDLREKDFIDQVLDN